MKSGGCASAPGTTRASMPIPKNADTVYVLNTGFYKSNDGGKTYTAISVPHGDNHDLWIAPDDPTRMINATTAAPTFRLTAVEVGPSRIRRPRSFIASRSTMIFLTTSTARNRTTRPCASPAAPLTPASPRSTGTTSAAVSQAGSRLHRKIRRLFSRVRTAAC